ncbi:MAG: hypothetical protein H6Q81_2354, partial [Deltaproteobacteria bacterium]|nr:hypothetical protein [Deltaproteobacteria bacterium]
MRKKVAPYDSRNDGETISVGDTRSVIVSIPVQAIPGARTPHLRHSRIATVIIPAERTAGVGAPARRTYAQDAGSARSGGRRFRSGAPCLFRAAHIADRRRNTARMWKIATLTPEMASRWARPVRRSSVTIGWEYGGTSPVASDRRYREPFVVPATRLTHSPVSRRARGNRFRRRSPPAPSGRNTAFPASAEKAYWAPCAIADHSRGIS